jgi:hypothetical protein
MSNISKYNTNVKPFLDKIFEWKKEGCTERIIAKRLGIDHKTFIRYKKKYSDLLDVIVEGEQNFLYEVEKALYRRALGYEFEETETIIHKNGDKENTKVVTRKKYYPPSDVAIFFTLTNLAPEKWKHKNEMDLNTNDLNIKINYIDDGDDEE